PRQAVAGCRLAQALTQYCVGANYGWLLAEGLFLHKLLVLAAFSGERCLPAFLLLGWGEPAAVWWIIRCPILMAVAVGVTAGGVAIPGSVPTCRGCHHQCPRPQVNFVVFVRIVRILVAKVRAHQVSRGDTRVRLAKSTLTLIPLLGIHEVVFAFVTDEHAQGTLRYVKLFFDLFLSSFQGMLVAVLYCFVNKEVR
ncbi:Glucagon receptor, partial [Eudyptes moseleyi]